MIKIIVTAILKLPLAFFDKGQVRLSRLFLLDYIENDDPISCWDSYRLFDNSKVENLLRLQICFLFFLLQKNYQ